MSSCPVVVADAIAMLLRKDAEARAMWAIKAASVGGLIFSGAFVSGYQLTKAQLQPGEYSAGATKHRHGIVAALQLRNQFPLSDDSELLIENLLSAFGAVFLRGGTHNGFPMPRPERAIPLHRLQVA